MTLMLGGLPALSWLCGTDVGGALLLPVGHSTVNESPCSVKPAPARRPIDGQKMIMKKKDNLWTAIDDVDPATPVVPRLQQQADQ
jgi:hypothetical protein